MADDEPSDQLAVRGDESLAMVDASGRVPDEYESEYMRGEGMVLHRDKSRAPWPLHALFGAAMLLTAATAFSGPGAWVGTAVSMPLLAMAWLLFSVLRVTVSEGRVNIQYGLFGPTIPIAAIESAEAVEYDWKSFGGWGIRVNAKREWIYNMPGDGGRAVRITWHDRKGKRKVTYVGSLESERLARQINRARELGPARTTPSLRAPKV